MPSLLVNPDSDSAWEIPLRPGTTSLGRSEENDVPIEHESISSRHCQVVISDQGAWIKDLGSTNGTFVEGELVEQARLQPGQIIHLGKVAMRFEMEEAPPKSAAAPALAPQRARATAATPTAAPAVAASTTQCRFHPRTLARFICPTCRQAFCDFCVSTHESSGTAQKFCRTCGIACTPLAVPLTALIRPAEKFLPKLGRAFQYPFVGDGMVLLVAGTLFYSLMDAAAFLAAFAGPFGLIAIAFLFIFGTGYLAAYLSQILTSSAMGAEALPDWPDFSDFSSDILSPFLQFLGTLLVSFLPAIILALFLDEEQAWTPWAIWGGVLFGCVYFPMAFLAVALFDSLAAVNPLLVVPSMVKVPGEYLLSLAVFAAVLAVRWMGEALLPLAMPRIVAAVVSSFAGLYLLIVEVRILGLLYRLRKDQLGWFTHRPAT
ncbi:MAG TPA: FHA domain-containing protein [Bacillota bacterium]|nr:FHA domain-containing protein [Bacillota bacterium]